MFVPVFPLVNPEKGIILSNFREKAFTAWPDCVGNENASVGLKIHDLCDNRNNEMFWLWARGAFSVQLSG